MGRTEVRQSWGAFVCKWWQSAGPTAGLLATAAAVTRLSSSPSVHPSDQLDGCASARFGGDAGAGSGAPGPAEALPPPTPLPPSTPPPPPPAGGGGLGRCVSAASSRSASAPSALRRSKLPRLPTACSAAAVQGSHTRNSARYTWGGAGWAGAGWAGEGWGVVRGGGGAATGLRLPSAPPR